jgi:hypothetical protein
MPILPQRMLARWYRRAPAGARTIGSALGEELERAYDHHPISGD